MEAITIVVPTHNRYDKLRALLRSISDHAVPEVTSVIVVDDSEKKESLESEFTGLHLRQLTLSGRAFISKAKNIGWKSADTDFVYFIDDDNVIDGTTVLPVYKAIMKDPRNGAVCPSVLYKERPNLVWVYATPFRDASLRHNLLGRNLPRNPDLENRLLPTDALPNASLVRRAALEEVGGFDEKLVVNSSMDLALRLKAKGWKVFADTGAFTYHDVEPPGEFGWWASHGTADPDRVRYEIRDWFLIMRRLHGAGPGAIARTVLESTRFVLPNLAAYAVRGKPRSRLVKGLLTGYIEGLFGVGP